MRNADLIEDRRTWIVPRENIDLRNEPINSTLSEDIDFLADVLADLDNRILQEGLTPEQARQIRRTVNFIEYTLQDLGL